MRFFFYHKIFHRIHNIATKLHQFVSICSKIFGNRNFKDSDFGDFGFADTKYGFGAAHEVTMNLTFAQAARGVNKDIVVNVVDTCQKCGGSRCELGTKPTKCQYCNGSGMETVSTGPFIMRSTCRYCAGTGQYNKYPCLECEGKGQNVSLTLMTHNFSIAFFFLFND